MPWCVIHVSIDLLVTGTRINYFIRTHFSFPPRLMQTLASFFLQHFCQSCTTLHGQFQAVCQPHYVWCIAAWTRCWTVFLKCPISLNDELLGYISLTIFASWISISAFVLFVTKSSVGLILLMICLMACYIWLAPRLHQASSHLKQIDCKYHPLLIGYRPMACLSTGRQWLPLLLLLFANHHWPMLSFFTITFASVQTLLQAIIAHRISFSASMWSVRFS